MYVCVYIYIYIHMYYVYASVHRTNRPAKNPKHPLKLTTSETDAYARLLVEEEAARAGHDELDHLIMIIIIIIIIIRTIT